MWFHRKLKNRRIGRDFVLDVKLRSSQVRATRVRMAAVALGVVFGVVLGVFLLWRGGQWALDALVYENSAFSIQTVEVQTDGVLAADQIRRWTGVRPGNNLFGLDLARVRRDLEMVSLIQSASLERVLPHTLRIRVTEREPLAQINVPRPRPNGGVEMVVFHLDAEGWVMVPLEAQQRANQAAPPDLLPVISGMAGTEVQAGKRLALPQVQAALQLLVAFESSPMEGLTDIRRIDVSASDVLTMTTGQGGEIVFAMANFDQQLRRWHVIHDSGERLGKAVATLDLAVSNNIPARWLEASSVPPSNPKVARPLRPRKKHV
jgi:cell division septal protein FtsQ